MEAVHDILESNKLTEDRLLERLSPEDLEALEKAQSSLLGSPVSLEYIANSVGVDYEYRSMSDGTYGALTKVEDREGSQRFRITVNRDDTRVRQRFTFAHELAHYFLHAQQVPPDGIRENIFLRAFNGNYSSEMEREANRLAAHILMPYTKIKAALEEGGSLVHLASIFDVSTQAMAIRLEFPPTPLGE